MQPDQFHELSISSRSALNWAFTRASQRASTEKSSSVLVSAADIMVGIFLAHPNSSEPYQLFEYFHLPLAVFYEALQSQGGFVPDNGPESPEQLDRMPPLDRDGQEVVEMSFALSRQYNQGREQRVSLRYLFGGVLTTPNLASDLLEKIVSGAGVPFRELVAAYPEFLRTPDEQRDFTTFLAERFPLPEAKSSEPAQYTASPALRLAVSGFSADVRTERDLIGIGAEVDAFAYLIASKALKPPLAIGLFGDWGSGKSFFMESLRQRIHKITADAQQSGQGQGKMAIYKYIAQIEFNAWHYVEGELWASLVEHIFRNLKTRPGDEPNLLQQRQQLVIDKLNAARLDQQAARERKKKLQEELSEAQQLVIRREQEREDALKQLNELKTANVLDALQFSNKEQEEIRRTLNELGVTKTCEGAVDLMRGTDELLDVLKRGNALTTRLRERGWRWVTMLLLVVAIGPVVSLTLSQVPKVSAITNLLTSLSAFLGGLTVILKHGTAWLSGTLARVEGARLQLDKKRIEVEANHAQKIVAAKIDYEIAATNYDQAKREENDKERQIVELKKELQQVTPGRVLLDFISERVGSQDYRKHLGIAALIRSDFEQLSQLIAEQNKKFEDKGEETDGEEEPLLINRIVLYIDDLDRCPPERVVQVLQAVHLLLAFPLFVVVVAVDARWLAQSLQKHYQELLATNARRDGMELSEGFGRQASPQDYLEKIFQIPFWVRPLPERARIRIVTDLVQKSLVPSAVASPVGPEVPGQSGPGGQGGVIDEEKRATATWEPSERRRPLNLQAETDLEPQGLDIEQNELQFMDELRSLLGQTPRSVKRFVNIYRLIKVVSLDRVPTFAAEKPDADFKLVLFLLAVLTGLPAISREFFRLLRADRSEIEQARVQIEGASATTWRTLAEVLAALRAVVSRTPEVLSGGPILARQDAGAGSQTAEKKHPASEGGCEDYYVHRDLDRLELWLKQYDGGSWLGVDATALADWTPQVARYSYRIEEL